MIEKEFTHDYFIDQLMEFRNMMGDKRHMSNQERMQRCATALGYVYMRAEGITESDGSLMRATLWEWQRRAEYVVTMPTEVRDE